MIAMGRKTFFMADRAPKEEGSKASKVLLLYYDYTLNFEEKKVSKANKKPNVASVLNNLSL